MEKIIYHRFLTVRDDFYDNPMQVYELAKQLDYYQPEHVTGLRSREIYHEPGVKKKLEKILGTRISRWDTDPKEENGVFYHTFSKGKNKEIPCVHSDNPHNDVTILIYLTPGLPQDCGTSFWKHKKTGLTDPPTSKAAEKNKMKLGELRELLEEDSTKRNKWQELDRISYKFNRLVAYPSGVLHSASKAYGSNLQNGRVYQIFRVGIDWNKFRK